MASNFQPRIENGKFAKDFTELRKIDGGSSGTVFEVREKRSRVVYAMKIMRFVPHDESKYEKKCANSTLALKFECDNLVKYHDVWREEKEDIYELFIQMEFCEYTLENISDMINKNPALKINNLLSLEAMQLLDDIVKQILNGVNYLHNLKDPVIHRDLNLVNILLKKTENGIVVKIADFDISKVHENDKVNTLDQGTPKYMAPELSKEYYNTKADIYSLGIIFKQLYHIDTDESYEDQGDQDLSQLLHKYRILKDLIIKMTETEDRKRPNCQEMLNDTKLWNSKDTNNDLSDILELEQYQEGLEIDEILDVKRITSKFFNSRTVWIRCLFLISLFFLYLASDTNHLKLSAGPIYFKFLKYNPNITKKSMSVSNSDLTKPSEAECFWRPNTNFDQPINDEFFCNGYYERKFSEIKEIGRGDHGIVFETIEKSSGKKFAIKKIMIESYEDLYRKELRISKLFSGLIIKYYDIWLENNCITKGFIDKGEKKFILYIQMELCDITLNQFIDEIDKTLAKDNNEFLLNYFIKSELSLEILKGINYLHKNNITHSDLRPSNILLKRENNSIKVKISDFCLSKISDMYETDYIIRENAKYRSQEFLEKKENEYEVNKTDIYSLGVILRDIYSIYFERSFADIEKIFPILASKLTTLKSLITEMRNPFPQERPDAQEILLKKHLWTINMTEFNLENEYKILSKSLNENSFVHIFIKSKLLNINDHCRYQLWAKRTLNLSETLETDRV